MSYRASYNRPYYGENKRHCGCEVPTFNSLANVEKVLLILKDKIKENGKATLADFYNTTGGLVIEGDTKFGWTDLLDCRIEYSRYGYRLYMPAPDYFDNNLVREAYDMLRGADEDNAYDTVIEAADCLSKAL